MSNKKNILQTSDQRNCGRLHQQRRHAVRETITKNQTESHHSSRSRNQTRLPARSWRRNELTTFHDRNADLSNRTDNDSLDSTDDDSNGYNSYIYHSGKVKAFAIQTAINDHDADFLDVLLRQLRLGLNRDKHFSNGFNRSKVRYSHTILTHAIDRGDSECIRLVLKNIFCGYLYPTIIDHVGSNGRTALWYACSKGNLHIVRELVERGHANINKCGILIVAAQNGREKIVDYLLNRGCDSNRRAKNYNESALHAASRRNHLGIVNALLKHGADSAILDYKKRTALDYAIHKRHIEIAKILIYHQGSHFAMTNTGFTPLMLAVCRNNTPIVDILLGILPHQQVLDELALLACNYTIYGTTSKHDQAYCYFERALSMTIPLCNSTPCEAYEFLSECQTLDELALIRENDNAMRMYALLVSERLLLKSGEVNHLISLIMKQSNVYRQYGEFHRCLQLRLHAYQLMNQTEHNVRHNPMLHENCLYALVSVLFIILYENNTLPIESLALVWTWTLNRANNALTKILFKLLCVATYLIESKSLTNNEQRTLLDLVRRTMRHNYVMPNGYFFLSYCIHIIATGLRDQFTFIGFSVRVMPIVQLLIHCGADVNEAHLRTKSTPLHLSSRCRDVDDARTLIRLLLSANAHIDSINRDGYLPENYAWVFGIKELLRANQKLSLKCRCAQLINSENVCYVNCLSSNLAAFVRMHSRN